MSESQPESTPGASLQDVRRALPSSVYERSWLLALGLLARDYAWLALSLLGLASHDGALVLPLWCLAGLSISGLFILGHDAAHGALLPGPRLNACIARLAMLPGLHGVRAWTLGHNRIHHGHTAREGMDYVWHPVSLAQYRALSVPARALHRLEWSALGAGVYYLREIWWSKQIRFAFARAHSPLRRELYGLACAVALYSAGLAALGFHRYGDAWGALWLWFKLLVAPFLVFGQIIGMVVYVQHISRDIRWQRTRRWSALHAQLQSTTSLRVSPFLNHFLHDILLHVPHHLDPRIPCYRLARAASHLERSFPETSTVRPLRFGAYWQTTLDCKLYDFDRQRWLPYVNEGE